MPRTLFDNELINRAQAVFPVLIQPPEEEEGNGGLVIEELVGRSRLLGPGFHIRSLRGSIARFPD
jgi:hypothetical protein